MLNIIVCIKQVLDPEAPTSTYKVDAETKRMLQQGVPPVMSPFDTNALEAALRIKATTPSKITVISLGKNLSKPVLRQSLAAGADDLILLEDNTFDGLDSYTTATILAAAIKKIEKYDLIFTGIQAADWNAGIVGSGIAELLKIPCITHAKKVEVHENNVKVECVTTDGYTIIDAPLPALITVRNELGELRSAPIKEVMAAQKRPIITWNSVMLGIEPEKLRRVEMLSLFIPTKISRCEVIKGDNEEQTAANLALRLKEENII